MSNPLLLVENISASYSSKPILQGVSINMNYGEIVSLIGHNGAGKSTLLKVIFGDLPASLGKVVYLGREITNIPLYRRREMGMSYLPQSSNVFSDLNIYDNLLVSGNGLHKADLNQRIEEVFMLFPPLKSMYRKRAGLLSGGERQMLAMGILLLTKPQLLLLDEPSAGLAPRLITEIMEKIIEINKTYGVAILLVEQKVAEALKISQRCYLLKNGQVALEGTSEEVKEFLNRRSTYSKS